MKSVAFGLMYAWLLMAQPVFAQSRGIGGVVRDPQQAVIPGAQVVLTNTRSSVKTTTITDSQGRYSFTSLSPGSYVLEVQATGFQLTTSQAIVQSGDTTVARDFTLVLARE